tara:strand:- start:134 stop:952 length:819 start_codon:yes stop_codon:yes gene_type:complete
MESGDKWAKAIGGPGGDTTQQAVANYHMRNALAPGETLLRSGIALPPGTNVPGSTVPALLREEAAAQAARESAAAKPPSRTSVVGKWSATTPGIAGKGLGIGLGGFAGYQGSKAYNDFNAAKTDSDKFSAIMDMLSAFGSGAAALPIPRAQIPGLALAAGVPLAKKFFGSPAKAADYPSGSPAAESDPVGLALRAGQASAGLAALSGAAAPVAIPVGLGLGAIDFARSGGKKEALLNAEKIRQFESLGDPTEEEIQEAINSGAYRQRIRGRR